MEIASVLQSLIPSWPSVVILASYFVYLGTAGSILPGKIVPGATLSDGSRLHYRCNGLFSLLLLVALLGAGVAMKLISPAVIADRGLELLSATTGFSILVTMILYVAGCQSRDQSSSLKPHITGSLIHDWCPEIASLFFLLLLVYSGSIFMAAIGTFYSA